MQTESQDIIIILVFSTLSMFSLATFFVYTVYRYQKRIQQKQKELFAAVIQAQEHEKERIANDLHDQVGPLLSNIKFNINLFDSPNKLQQFKQDNNKLINVVINNIRTAAYNLLPKVLYDFGLIEALEDLCELMSRGTNIDIQFYSNNTLTQLNILTKQSELTIYRIVMEIVNNAVKYSNASRLEVKIDLGNETCNISVTDNGIGFDVNKIAVNKNHGMGIKNIFSRVDVFNGHCQLNSNQSGTTYQIIFQTKNLV